MKWIKRGLGFALLSVVLLSTNEANAAPLFDSELRLVASDGSASNLFGTSVAISGGTAAVWSLDVPNELAATYIYEFNGSTWAQTQKLEPATPFRGFIPFGDKMVDIDGNLLVMGAPPASPEAGPAYVFARVGGTWVLQFTIDRGPFVNNDLFGAAVSISGQTIAIAAPTSGIVTNEGGAVYIYVQSGTNWIQQAVITAPDPAVQQQFGRSVALDGNTLLVGSRGDRDVGAAYVFVRNGNSWSFQAKLESSIPEDRFTFSSSVALSGDTAVIGNRANNLNGEGDVHVFVRSNGLWTFQQLIRPTVFPPDTVPVNFFFGSSVAIKNDVIVIGAPGPLPPLTSIPSNAAYVYTRSNGVWVLIQTLAPTNPQANQRFGASVDVDAQAAIVGAPNEDSPATDAGAAYVFFNAPPVLLSASATPSVLFPPNHKLVPVTINITSQGNFASCKIVSVTSNEPINGRGDGNTSPDWIINGDLTLLLRAERSGPNKIGRIYTIAVQCTDTLGNSVTTHVLVTVPHDNRNK